MFSDTRQSTLCFVFIADAEREGKQRFKLLSHKLSLVMCDKEECVMCNYMSQPKNHFSVPGTQQLGLPQNQSSQGFHEKLATNCPSESTLLKV